MNEQEKRIQRRKEEDSAFNRMLLWLAGCVVLEALTLLLRQLYFSYTDLGLAVAGALNAFFNVFRFAGLVLTAAGAVWTVLSIRQGKHGKQLAAPIACTGAAAWLWAVSLMCSNYTFAYETGMGLLCVLPVVIAALAAVFFLYQREFFFNALLGGAGITALWVYKHIYMNHPRATYLGFAVVWVFLAAGAVAAFMLKQRKGRALGRQILPAGANYPLLLLTCVLSAAALAAALAIGVAAAYYIMFALIAWLFCLAVYYTVKLM